MLKIFGVIFIHKEKTPDEESAMVGCSNAVCERGLFFHLEHVDLQEAPGATQDWWCSDECQATGMSALCFCAEQKDGPIVHCA